VYADLDLADPIPFVAELTRGLRRRAGAAVTRPAVTTSDDRRAEVAA
jgi:hypothetical protein